MNSGCDLLLVCGILLCVGDWCVCKVVSVPLPSILLTHFYPLDGVLLEGSKGMTVLSLLLLRLRQVDRTVLWRGVGDVVLVF